MKSVIGSFSSTLSILYLLDSLYACVFRRRYDYNLEHKYKTASEFQTMRHSDNPVLDDRPNKKE